MSYATNTEVSVEKSRMELERTLQRYGATRFAYMTGEEGAMIGFVINSKSVKFILPLPSRNDKKFTHWKPGNGYYEKPRTQEKALAAWEQACRCKWRALCLCVKAKLEAVESGITSFEAEFLAHFVMPNGQTFGEYAIPQIEEASQSGRMPSLMLCEA